MLAPPFNPHACVVRRTSIASVCLPLVMDDEQQIGRKRLRSSRLPQSKKTEEQPVIAFERSGDHSAASADTLRCWHSTLWMCTRSDRRNRAVHTADLWLWKIVAATGPAARVSKRQSAVFSPLLSADGAGPEACFARMLKEGFRDRFQMCLRAEIPLATHLWGQGDPMQEVRSDGKDAQGARGSRFAAIGTGCTAGRRFRKNIGTHAFPGTTESLGQLSKVKVANPFGDVVPGTGRAALRRQGQGRVAAEVGADRCRCPGYSGGGGRVGFLATGIVVIEPETGGRQGDTTGDRHGSSNSRGLIASELR